MDLILHLCHCIVNYFMLIDIDIPYPIALEEVQAKLYLKEIIFQLTPDE